MLLDSYLCPRCPGNVRIAPASEQAKHEAWHHERDRRFKTGEAWLFGNAKGRKSRLKRASHRPTGHRLKKEGLWLVNVNKALGK